MIGNQKLVVSRGRAAFAASLLGMGVFLGCGAASEKAPQFVAVGVVRPIRPDRTMAARIGRQALEEYGYEEIIRRAVKARFLRYPAPPELTAGNLLGQTLEEAGRQAWPVFTQWAVAAGITSQLDSPAPGPADVVAIGELVVGLFHAGVVGVMVLTMSADTAGPTQMMSKMQSEREGDGTRGKTVEEIIEAYKDKLSKGELKKLIEQIQKLRGQRNKNKDSRKK